MNILFIIKALSVTGGGAERVLADVSGELAARGHSVAIASFDRADAEDFYAIDPIVRRLRLGVGDESRPTGLFEALGRMRAVRRLVRTEKPDVVVGFMHSIYIPQGLALLGSGIPLVASEHIVFDHYRTVPFQSALLRLTPMITSAITVISERVRASFPPALQRRMTVIPNPVSAAPARLADVSGGSRKTMLTVGRMMEQKDHATLISAFAKLADRHPDWRLRIIGDGPLRGALEEQVRALDLADRIELPGPTRDIGREYQQAQIFAMPSRYESFGLVTAEALAYGLPVVGFADCPGTNELVHDGTNGLLVDGDDRGAALATGLQRVMESEELRRRLAQNAPESVAAFSLQSVADRWESLLRSVTSGAALQTWADRAIAAPDPLKE